MSEAFEPDNPEREFLGLFDSLNGAVLTLEQSVDMYIDTLGEHLGGNPQEPVLEDSIDFVVDSLERMYDTEADLDEVVARADKKAYIKRDGERGVCDLEENLSRISNGIYKNIESFNDLVTLMHYIEQDGGIDPDPAYLEPQAEEPHDSTSMIGQSERLLETAGRVNKQYNRIAYAEIIMRQNVESEDPMESYAVDPPVVQLMSETDYFEKAKSLNRQIQKL